MDARGLTLMIRTWSRLNRKAADAVIAVVVREEKTAAVALRLAISRQQVEKYVRTFRLHAQEAQRTELAAW